MEKNRGLTRRDFLKIAAAGAVTGACRPPAAMLSSWRSSAAPIDGTIIGSAHATGHLLMNPSFPAPSAEIRTRVLIIGGGMAGLSAAWKLDKSGMRDFLVLELESDLGGNSRFGENAVTAYPWGAHYVTLPDPAARDICELLEDIGVITGRDRGGELQFDEQALCFAPHERLFIHGRWQDGLFPQLGAGADDLAQYQAFRETMDGWRRTRGKDGRKAFDIPVDASSRDAQFISLDRVSMADYMTERGWPSPRLRWFVNYACRDDYGSTVEDTSAWAGIHYWAARPNAGKEHEDVVLTWPEGNGRLVRLIRDRIADRCRTDALVFRVAEQSGGVSADIWLGREQKTLRVRCDRAILAVPQFVAARIIDSRNRLPADLVEEFVYSPWMVANLRIDGAPREKGTPLAWDNVLYDSDSLGYVVATHQRLTTHSPESVWTYYLPLTRGSPDDERRSLLARAWPEWRDSVLNDLSRAHPDIEDHVRRIDVMRWGHAMIRPRPGFIWGAARKRAAQTAGRLFFAHSDLSGISLVEEAIARGFSAAKAVMEKGVDK